MQLKKYQNDTLAVIKAFFDALDTKTPGEAYESVTSSADMIARLGNLRKYEAAANDTPTVAIKVPTGGGKTIIAAHAVKVIAECQGRECPFIVWFAPSETIRRQTADALKKARHPYRQALNEAFKGNVQVFDLDEVFMITPSDIERNACIVVATEQAFVKKDKEKYNVYKHNENYEPHFAAIRLAEGMDAQEDNPSQPKFSFVNLVHSRRPIVIGDEAHKMVSELSKETLTRLAPSAVLGLTATPEKGNNTLYSVPAKDLFDEEMIKLPVELTEFREDWRQAVFAAIEKRQELERLADREFADGSGGYLRPLVLFQAQANTKTAEVPVDVLKAFLTDTAKLPTSEIAVVTGEQKELDGIDVTDPQSPIKYIITVQALKEGWDCPSAYILCSVANIASGTDTIQLLGRVMRQPEARRRKTPQLNRAYAFVMSRTFGQAASELAEGLRKKGFDETEAAAAIVMQPDLGLKDDEDEEDGLFNQPGTLVLDSETYEAVASELPDELKIAANADGSGTIEVTAEISDDAMKRVVSALESKGYSTEAAKFIRKVERKRREAMVEIPAKGHKMVFPRLCAEVQGELCLNAADATELVGLGVETELPPKLPDGAVALSEGGDSFELMLDGNKIKQQFVQTEMEGFLRDLKTDYSAGDVVNELNALVVYHGISPRAKFGWITGVVNDLVTVKGIKPIQLYCYRYKLKARLERLLSEAADRIREQAYQAVFSFGQETYPLQLDLDGGFAFDAAMYADAPLMKVYRGGTRFTKHYLGPNCVPAFDGEKKDGEGEEFDCAVQIDAHPAVRFWLRNLAKHHRSFSLPLSHDSFYPDFVGELTDGRLFAVEYKGEHLRNAKDTLEKDAIGRLWAAKSGGKCLYATVYKSDGGLDVKGQLDKLFANE